VESSLRPAAPPIRVAIAAGETLLRELLARLAPELVICSGDRDACDVRLVGPAPLPSGDRDARLDAASRAEVPWLVVAPDDATREWIRDWFRAGAQDVLLLGEAPRGLVPAIRRALQAGSALERLQRSYDQTLEALVCALDLREQETAGHSLRVALYALHLAIRMGVPQASLRDLYHGALLHDIGKIGIPDDVLLKPGRLSEEEWRVMRTHAQLGGDILRGIAFLRSASEIPLHHHEAWDGSGYPAGLVARDIPLHARIFAVVDTYDALRSERPYKGAHSHAESVERLRAAGGSRLDPAIVDHFAQAPPECWEALAAAAPRERGFARALACAHVPEPQPGTRVSPRRT
jgi:putative nucleotidyltransferase with HDIG domain